MSGTLEKKSIQEMEEAFRNFAEEAKRPRTKEEIDEGIFRRLKSEYTDKNPYFPTGNFDDGYFRWNDSHSQSINSMKECLLERGRKDLVDKFEDFVNEQESLKVKAEEQKIIDKLLKNGIDLNKVQDPEVKKYILYLEKRNGR